MELISTDYYWQILYSRIAVATSKKSPREGSASATANSPALLAPRWRSRQPQRATGQENRLGGKTWKAPLRDGGREAIGALKPGYLHSPPIFKEKMQAAPRTPLFRPAAMAIGRSPAPLRRHPPVEAIVPHVAWLPPRKGPSRKWRRTKKYRKKRAAMAQPRIHSYNGIWSAIWPP